MTAQPATLQNDSLAEHGELVRHVLRALKDLDHGQVQGIFQGSHAAQPDNTEKRKLV